MVDFSQSSSFDSHDADGPGPFFDIKKKTDIWEKDAYENKEWAAITALQQAFVSVTTNITLILEL